MSIRNLTLSKLGMLAILLHSIMVFANCSAGKENVVHGESSVLVNPRLQMSVTHVQNGPKWAIGRSENLPGHEFNLVTFLALPNGAQFSGTGNGSEDGEKILSHFGWSGGDITFACDFDLECGTINGKGFKLAGGNVLLVSLDAKGISSFLAQFADDTEYPSNKPDGTTNYSASDDFLELLRKRHAPISELIQGTGGSSHDRK